MTFAASRNRILCDLAIDGRVEGRLHLVVVNPGPPADRLDDLAEGPTPEPLRYLLDNAECVS